MNDQIFLTIVFHLKQSVSVVLRHRETILGGAKVDLDHAELLLQLFDGVGYGDHVELLVEVLNAVLLLLDLGLPHVEEGLRLVDLALHLVDDLLALLGVVDLLHNLVVALRPGAFLGVAELGAHLGGLLERRL